MANELKAKYTLGLTAKALVFNRARTQIWSVAGTAWVTYTPGAIGSLANYKITATDLTGRGNYVATMPAGITTADIYGFEFINNADDSTFATGEIPWSGTAEITEINYWAAVYYTRDNNSDDFIVVWYCNSTPILSGITTPLIQLYLVSDGSDLIASTAMTEIASTQTFKYTTTGSRLSTGVGAVLKVSATINGAVRTTIEPLGRDST
jgi:hypothetical protein